jgi:hypothetical protein
MKSIKVKATLKALDHTAKTVSAYEFKGDSHEVKSDGNLDFSKLEDSAELELKVRNDTGTELTFGSPAMYVAEGSVCPTAPGFDNGGVSAAPDPHDKLKLTITDTNLVAGTFGYTLRFQDSGGEIYILDPIIDNSGKGGGTPPPPPPPPFPVHKRNWLAAAAIGSVVAGLYGWVRRRRKGGGGGR